MNNFKSEYEKMQYIAGLQSLNEASNKGYQPRTKTVPNPNAGKWRIMSGTGTKKDEIGGGKFFDTEKDAMEYAKKNIKVGYKLVQLGKDMKVYKESKSIKESNQADWQRFYDEGYKAGYAKAKYECDGTFPDIFDQQ